MADKFSGNETMREYEREIINRFHDMQRQQGIVFDPADMDSDALQFFGAVSDPTNLPFLVGGKLVKGANVLNKLTNTRRALARAGFKKLALIPQVGSFLTEQFIKKVREKTAFIPRKTAEFIEERLTPGKIPELEGLPSAKSPFGFREKAVQTVRSPFRAGRKAVGLSQAAARKTKQFFAGASGFDAERLNLIAKGGKTGNLIRRQDFWKNVVFTPDTQVRFLDRLARDGNKTAAIFSRLGGTKLGDIGFNIMADAFPAGLVNALEAKIAGGDLEAQGAAFGTALGIVGGTSPFAPTGAGAPLTLLTPEGGLTSRGAGGAEKAARQFENNKVNALADLELANNFDKLPNEVKAVAGVFAEAGALPRQIVALDSKNFNLAMKELKGRQDITHSDSQNAAVYFAEDDVILINSDSPAKGPALMALVGEEFAHSMTVKMFQRDPNLMRGEVGRFTDESGREMPLAARNMRETVKVNKDLTQFVDGYNKLAAESGAKPIVTFEEAIHEMYGAQAGILMSQNKVFSKQVLPNIPLPVRKAAHAARGALLRATGKVVRNTPDVKANFEKGANTPMGKHMRDQFRVWVAEGDAINKATDAVFQKATTGSRNPSEAQVKLQDNPAVTGFVKRPPDGLSTSRKTAQPTGGLMKLALTTGAEPVKNAKGITKSAIIQGAIPETVKQAWVRQFPQKEQQGARRWIDQVEKDSLNKQASIFDYTTMTGTNKGKTNTRHMVPENVIRINDQNQIFIQTRDMVSINHNINKAVIEGRAQGRDADTIRAQVLAELDLRQQDIDFEVSDQTRAILGERNKKSGKPLEGDWAGFDPGPEGRPLRDFDIEGLMGYGDAAGEGLFGQARGQQGLIFSNPQKVNQSVD